MMPFKLKVPRPPQPPTAPKGLGTRRRGPDVARTTIHQYGPKWLHKQRIATLDPDWCVPWPTFVGAHTSLPEQMLYRAIARKRGTPTDPSKPPYTGGVDWDYQDPLGTGGRLTRGGVVCDFVIHDGGEDVCIRLQTEYFHLKADMAKKADEAFEKSHSTGGPTIDIYDTSFVADCTGEAACRVVAEALAGRDQPNPAVLGTFTPVRRRGGSRTS